MAQLARIFNVRRTAGLPQHFPKKSVFQRDDPGSLVVVRRAAVAPFRVLIIEHVVPHLFHLGIHLPRMRRMHAVVAGRRGKQDSRILQSRSSGFVPKKKRFFVIFIFYLVTVCSGEIT